MRISTPYHIPEGREEVCRNPITTATTRCQRACRATGAEGNGGTWSTTWLKTVMIWMLLAFSALQAAAEDRFTLVIDPGHGGRDAGALGKISKEKNINLNVALAFGKLVEKNCPDVKVVYTRKTDVSVPLYKRAEIANRNKANLFISIHTNALPKGVKARGLETYTLGMHRANDNLDVAKRENAVILIEQDYKKHYEGFDPNSAESYIIFELMQDKNMQQSVEMARLVQQRTCAAAGRPNKGVRQAGFLVLRETSMPSCLIELGFITTPDEERFLNSRDGINSMARGIYNAFIAYKQKYHRNKKIDYKELKDNSSFEQKQATAAEKPKAAAKPTATQRTKAAAVKSAPKKAEDAESIAAELSAARSISLKELKKITEENEQTGAGKPEKEEEPEPTTEAEDTRTAEAPAEAPAGSTAADDATAPDNGKKAEETAAEEQHSGAEPVFKVQILTSGRLLKDGNPQLKGLKDVDYYTDNGVYKYTCGASENYNEIYRLRKSILQKFPQAFIIAFKNGQRTDVVEAIKEFKNKRKIK